MKVSTKILIYIYTIAISMFIFLLFYPPEYLMIGK